MAAAVSALRNREARAAYNSWLWWLEARKASAEKMRAALRGKVEKRSPPQSVMGGPPEGKSGADLKE